MPSTLLNRLAAALPAIENSKKVQKSSEMSKTSVSTEWKQWKFALALPIVDVKTLPTYSRECPFCQEPYNSSFKVAGRKFGHEAPAMLPCSCVIGFHCARSWLSPHESRHTSCPLCEQDFSYNAEEEVVGSITNSDLEPLDVSRNANELGFKQEETESDEETAKPAVPLARAASVFLGEVRHLLSIDEVLMAGTSSPNPGFPTLRRNPAICVTTPEGLSCADHESEMEKSFQMLNLGICQA